MQGCRGGGTWWLWGTDSVCCAEGLGLTVVGAESVEFSQLGGSVTTAKAVYWRQKPYCVGQRSEWDVRGVDS